MKVQKHPGDTEGEKGHSFCLFVGVLLLQDPVIGEFVNFRVNDNKYLGRIEQWLSCLAR